MAQIRYTDLRGYTQNGTVPWLATGLGYSGDFIIWDTTNGAQRAVNATSETSAGPAAAVSGADNSFLGRMNEDYNTLAGVVKTRISFTKATPMVEFLVWVINSVTAGSSIAAPLVNLGVAYEMWYESRAKGWAVDIQEATDVMWIISGYDSGDKATDGLPNWPDSAVAGTNLYPPVWVAPVLAKCTLVR